MDHKSFLSLLQTLSTTKDSLNEPDEEGQSSLHRAVQLGLGCDAISALIQNGAQINQPDYEKRTPLHHAAETGLLPVVKYLISLPNIDVNATDVLNRTPLHAG